MICMTGKLKVGLYIYRYLFTHVHMIKIIMEYGWLNTERVMFVFCNKYRWIICEMKYSWVKCNCFVYTYM